MQPIRERGINNDSLHSQDKQFEQVENFLLNHPDKEYKTSRFVYYFKQVGDCAGDDEIIAYYHDGEF